VQRLLELSSIEAVVNARLISLRAPIDGRIEDLAPAIGAAVAKGRLMLHISNSRADRARLDDLQRLVDQTEGERPATVKRLVRLKEIYEQISRQARAFQTGRIRELEERMMDLKAQVSATEASESEAASTLMRTKTLAASGYQTKVAVERAERDAKIAAQTQTSLNHRLFASVVELEAARRGEYVGDSYNDRPSSLQHADELSVRIAEAEAELSSRDERLAKLRAALDAEAARYSDLSNVALASPIDGQVWEVMVSPGEEVRKAKISCAFSTVPAPSSPSQCGSPSSIICALAIRRNSAFLASRAYTTGRSSGCREVLRLQTILRSSRQRFRPEDIGSLCRSRTSRRHNAESAAPERWYSTPRRQVAGPCSRFERRFPSFCPALDANARLVRTNRTSSHGGWLS